jgi:hypothetical protein
MGIMLSHAGTGSFALHMLYITVCDGYTSAMTAARRSLHSRIGLAMRDASHAMATVDTEHETHGVPASAGGPTQRIRSFHPPADKRQ